MVTDKEAHFCGTAREHRRKAGKGSQMQLQAWTLQPQRRSSYEHSHKPSAEQRDSTGAKQARAVKCSYRQDTAASAPLLLGALAYACWHSFGGMFPMTELTDSKDALSGQRCPGRSISLALLNEPDVTQPLEAILQQVDQAWHTYRLGCCSACLVTSLLLATMQDNQKPETRSAGHAADSSSAVTS